MTEPPKPPAEPEGTRAQRALEGLLATEQELEAMLADTRREARALVEGSRERAAAQVAAMEATLEEEARALRARIDADREEAIADVERDAREEEARLAGLDGARIGALARYVVHLLVSDDERGEAP